ncbi:MAG: ABC transporter permease [Gemmatimonadaceae bacterium]
MTSIPAARESQSIDTERVTSPLGGFNFKAVRLEITRVLRNRRTLFFIVVFPGIFFFMFGLSNKQARQAGGPVLAYIMISMAVYGAMVGTTSGGASVALERSLGWSRQLRLTPLRPAAYVTMKVMASMVLGLLAICSTFTIGSLNGVHMPVQTWLLCGVSAWLASLVFAAFGLFVGFLVPAENVMQFVGPLLAVMATFGGLFIPLNTLPQGMQTVARYTPMYGVSALAHAPLINDTTMWSKAFSNVFGAINDSAWAVGSVAIWTVMFGIGAMLLFRRDTARV